LLFQALLGVNRYCFEVSSFSAKSAGMLIAFSHHKKILPRQVRQKAGVLKDFQSFIRSQGIETHWPKS
jgi:hypothetical protein